MTFSISKEYEKSHEIKNIEQIKQEGWQTYKRLALKIIINNVDKKNRLDFHRNNTSTFWCFQRWSSVTRI
ncbi:unnamed protein product [Brugia timori]|uniref:Uncharacterized protein n=1 Tax=Brugia timori TaxID=42155 RepID=A0A0R3R8W1_9BILA|nr:unnamed protein product [Brugia timori]